MDFQNSFTAGNGSPIHFSSCHSFLTTFLHNLS